MKKWLLLILAMISALQRDILVSADSDPSPYEWKLITKQAEFASRDGAGLLSYRGQLWLLGGWNPDKAQRKFFPRICNNEVWSSSNGLSWKLVKPNTFHDTSFDRNADWEGRHTAGYAVFKDRMWIVGGDCNQGHYQNDVWTSEDGKTWKYVNKDHTPPWAPRALHYTVVHNDQLWVIGGQTMPAFGGGNEKFYRDLWTSRDGVDWQQISAQEPYWSPRGMIGGAAVKDGRIWVLGGGTYDTPTTPTRQFFNDVWSSPDGIQWKLHNPSAPWHPRQYHDVAVWDDKLWVMEGYHATGGNRKDVWYSADGEHWTELKNTPWAPRHAASLVPHDGELWLVAGNNMQPDVWKLRKK